MLNMRAAFFFCCYLFAEQLWAAEIERISRDFLNIAYGSGANIVDKNLRAKSFDCMTFVETVLALHKAGDDQDPLPILERIRYFNSRRDEVLRKHFVEIDWIQDNEKLGFIKDISQEIFPAAIKITALIDKKSWFEKMHPALTKKFMSSPLPKTIEASMNSIPLDRASALLAKIPDNSIVIFFHRDPEKFRELIGTPLLVGHMGFLVRINGQAYFRSADSVARRIVDTEWDRAIRDSSRLFRGFAILKTAEHAPH